MYIDNYGRIIHADASEGMKYGVPQLNKFPLPDARHVKSAIKFFNYVPPKYEKQLASAIIRRMKEYGLSFDDFTVGEENRFKKYVPDTYLAHHGILGQKWGRKNGPPYPLGSSDHSAAEKKAGWRKSLAEGAGKAARLTGKGLAKAGSWTVDKIVMWKRFPNRLLSDKTLERKRERYALENDVIRSTGRMPRDQKLAARLERGKYRREVAKLVIGETLKAVGSQALGTYIKKKLENKADAVANQKKKDLDFNAAVRGDIYKDARDNGLSAKEASKLARAGKEVLRTEDPYRGLDTSVKKKAQETAFDKATKAGKSIDEALKFAREGGAGYKDGLHKQYEDPIGPPAPPKKDNNQYDKPIEIPLPPKQPNTPAPKPKEKITYNSNTFTRENSDDFIGPPRKRTMTGAAAKAHYKKSYINMKLRDLWNSGFKDAHVVGGKIVFANGERAWNVDSGFKSYIDYIMKGLA